MAFVRSIFFHFLQGSSYFHRGNEFPFSLNELTFARNLVDLRLQPPCSGVHVVSTSAIQIAHHNYVYF